MATRADVRRNALALPGAEARVPNLGVLAGVVLLAATCTFQACATAGMLSQHDALAYARQDVCGAAAADSVCIVRSVERTERGYHIVIDRRPPAGHDRVAVDVRGGVFKGRRVEVTPVDTATRRP